MCHSMEDYTGRERRKVRETVCMIQFVSYKICYRQNGGLKYALHGMVQENMDLGIFQETKSMGGIYMHELAR